MDTTFMNPPIIQKGSLTLEMITLFMDFLYVNKEETCGGMTPCYDVIQEAVNAAVSGAVIRVAEGTYSEGVILDAPKALVIQGGWNTLFTTQTSGVTFIKPPVAKQGSVTLRIVGIRP